MCTKEIILQKYKNLCHNCETQKSTLLKSLKKFEPITIDDHESDNKVCFVFSCPGNNELIKNKVCAGATGENLDTLLEILYMSNSEVFDSKKRYDYPILNATQLVHFKEFDGKTEAYNSEIINDDNLKRVERFLKKHREIEYVILFGKKAELLKDKIQESIEYVKIATTCHLGYQAINQIKNDTSKKTIEDNDPKVRTRKRLEVIAKSIITQLNL